MGEGGAALGLGLGWGWGRVAAGGGGGADGGAEGGEVAWPRGGGGAGRPWRGPRRASACTGETGVAVARAVVEAEMGRRRGHSLSQSRGRRWWHLWGGVGGGCGARRVGAWWVRRHPGSVPTSREGTFVSALVFFYSLA